MPKFKVYLQYVGYAETTVEANDKGEAMDIVCDTMDFDDFDGSFEVQDIVELEDDDA